MKTCGDCAHYGTAPTTGPICTKTGKATSFLLAGKPCWEERTAGPDVLTKVCNRCHRELPITEFSRNHTRKDGYQYQCKDCQREMARATYISRAQPEKPAEPKETPTTKVCAKCGRELPVENFGHTPKNSNGLKSYCKDCENENCRTYRAKRKAAKKAAKVEIPTPHAPAKDITLEDVAIPAEELTLERAIRQLMAYGSLTIKITISKS